MQTGERRGPEEVHAIRITERGTVNTPGYFSRWSAIGGDASAGEFHPRSDDVYELYNAVADVGRARKVRVFFVDTDRPSKETYPWWAVTYIEDDGWSIVLQEVKAFELGFNGRVLIDESAQVEVLEALKQEVPQGEPWVCFDCGEWKISKVEQPFAVQGRLKPIVILGERKKLLPEQERNACAVVSLRRDKVLKAFEPNRFFHVCAEILPWVAKKDTFEAGATLKAEWIHRFLLAMRRGARVDVAHREACVNGPSVRRDVALVNGITAWHPNPKLKPKALPPLPPATHYAIVQPFRSGGDALALDAKKVVAALGEKVVANRRFEWDPGATIELVARFKDEKPLDPPAVKDEMVVVTIQDDASSQRPGSLDVVQQIHELLDNPKGFRFAFLMAATDPAAFSKQLQDIFRGDWHHDYVLG